MSKFYFNLNFIEKSLLIMFSLVKFLSNLFVCFVVLRVGCCYMTDCLGVQVCDTMTISNSSAFPNLPASLGQDLHYYEDNCTIKWWGINSNPKEKMQDRIKYEDFSLTLLYY